MSDNVDNLILEQLRLIRQDLTGLQGQIGSVRDEVGDIQTGQQALQGMMNSMFGYVRGLDERVEHIEKKLGIEE